MRHMPTVVLSGNGRYELDAWLHKAVGRHDVPGVVAEVANREHALYRGAFGKFDERGAADMPADAIFRIASMTNPVTSVAVMMLKDQGSHPYLTRLEQVEPTNPINDRGPCVAGHGAASDFELAPRQRWHKPVIVLAP